MSNRKTPSVAAGGGNTTAGHDCIRSKSPSLTLVLVSVVPNARSTEVVGLHDGALRVRLAAPPVDGKANDTLTAWVAAQLKVPKREVRLLRGASSRQKQLAVDLPAAPVEAWVTRSLAALDPQG
jgi:uncharacterized protein